LTERAACYQSVADTACLKGIARHANSGPRGVTGCRLARIVLGALFGSVRIHPVDFKPTCIGRRTAAPLLMHAVRRIPETRGS